MVMKPTLQLRIGTQLTMTPQLQQAIQLLQLSTLDLRQEIQQALESNPMLELDEDYGEQVVADSAEVEWAEDIPTELVTDSEWSDTYQDAPASRAVSTDGNDIERNVAGLSLRDHLHWQLTMADMSARSRQIADCLIDSITPAGYLDASLDDLAEGLRGQGLGNLKSQEVEQVLQQVQQFEPTGVAPGIYANACFCNLAPLMTRHRCYLRPNVWFVSFSTPLPATTARCSSDAWGSTIPSSTMSLP